MILTGRDLEGLVASGQSHHFVKVRHHVFPHGCRDETRDVHKVNVGFFVSGRIWVVGVIDERFGIDFEHLAFSEFVVESAGEVGLVRGLGDDGGNLCDVGGRDGAAVEAGETEEEEPLFGGEVAVLDEDRHHLPRVILCTGDKDVLFAVFLDGFVEFSTDVSHRCAEELFLRLGREVLPGN